MQVAACNGMVWKYKLRNKERYMYIYWCSGASSDYISIRDSSAVNSQDQI